MCLKRPDENVIQIAILQVDLDCSQYVVCRASVSCFDIMGENSAQNGFSVLGKTFPSEEDFFEAFHNFCKTSYQPFIIVTINKRQVTLQCRLSKNI